MLRAIVAPAHQQVCANNELSRLYVRDEIVRSRHEKLQFVLQVKRCSILYYSLYEIDDSCGMDEQGGE